MPFAPLVPRRLRRGGGGKHTRGGGGRQLHSPTTTTTTGRRSPPPPSSSCSEAVGGDGGRSSALLDARSLLNNGRDDDDCAPSSSPSSLSGPQSPGGGGGFNTNAVWRDMRRVELEARTFLLSESSAVEEEASAEVGADEQQQQQQQQQCRKQLGRWVRHVSRVHSVCNGLRAQTLCLRQELAEHRLALRSLMEETQAQQRHMQAQLVDARGGGGGGPAASSSSPALKFTAAAATSSSSLPPPSSSATTTPLDNVVADLAEHRRQMATRQMKEAVARLEEELCECRGNVSRMAGMLQLCESERADATHQRDVERQRCAKLEEKVADAREESIQARHALQLSNARRGSGREGDDGWGPGRSSPVEIIVGDEEEEETEDGDHKDDDGGFHHHDAPNSGHGDLSFREARDLRRLLAAHASEAEAMRTEAVTMNAAAKDAEHARLRAEAQVKQLTATLSVLLKEERSSVAAPAQRQNSSPAPEGGEEASSRAEAEAEARKLGLILGQPDHAAVIACHYDDDTVTVPKTTDQLQSALAAQIRRSSELTLRLRMSNAAACREQKSMQVQSHVTRDLERLLRTREQELASCRAESLMRTELLEAERRQQRQQSRNAGDDENPATSSPHPPQQQRPDDASSIAQHSLKSGSLTAAAASTARLSHSVMSLRSTDKSSGDRSDERERLHLCGKLRRTREQLQQTKEKERRARLESHGLRQELKALRKRYFAQGASLADQHSVLDAHLARIARLAAEVEEKDWELKAASQEIQRMASTRLNASLASRVEELEAIVEQRAQRHGAEQREWQGRLRNVEAELNAQLDAANSQLAAKTDMLESESLRASTLESEIFDARNRAAVDSKWMEDALCRANDIERVAALKTVKKVFDQWQQQKLSTAWRGWNAVVLAARFKEDSGAASSGSVPVSVLREADRQRRAAQSKASEWRQDVTALRDDLRAAAQQCQEREAALEHAKSENEALARHLEAEKRDASALREETAERAGEIERLKKQLHASARESRLALQKSRERAGEMRSAEEAKKR